MIYVYRGFKIEIAKMKVRYAGSSFDVVHYVVYKEIKGERYFLPGVTAFDSLEKAQEAIDEMEADYE